MLTLCPACATRFRVTAEQIKARAGRVRCGACQHAFNALDSLVEEPIAVMQGAVIQGWPQGVAPSPASHSVGGQGAPGADEFSVPPAPSFSADSVGSADARQNQPFEPSPPEPIPHEQSREATGPELVPAATESAVADVAVVIFDQPADGPGESLVEPAPERSPSLRWPWVIGSLLALVALGLQAAIAFRVELAVLLPQARPLLVTLCEIAECEVGLPAKVALVGIEASDLHPEGDAKGRLALSATLKNRAPFAQQYPHLELTLTDTADKAVARKILAPVDYLPRTLPAALGMQSNADVIVSIGIDAGELPASGYRLYLFYP